MNLEKSKKVLKISGILTILSAVVVLVLGILAVAGSNILATEAADQKATEDAALAFTAGILLIVLSIIDIFEGFISYRAGKNGKKKTATIALVFAVISTIGAFVDLFRNTNGASAIVGAVVGIALDVLILYSAYTVMKNGEE